MCRAIFALFIFLFPFLAHSQIVDTWQFNSVQEQEYSLQIASQLRCPQCQNQNLLESNAPSAVSMRHQVFKMVADGKSEAQIKTYMTDRFGDFVLYNPPLTSKTFVLWAIPLVAFIMILFLFYRYQKISLKKSRDFTPDKPHVQTEYAASAIRAPSQTTKPKLWHQRINSLGFCLLITVIAGYFLLPRYQLVYHEYQRITDPLLSFSPLEQTQRDLERLQENIRQSPENGELWATLGEYYLFKNSYENSLIAYQRALKYTGENAQLYSAIATVLYYQSGQQIDQETQYIIDKALSLDKNETTALMLLASDAFMNANYEKAITIWQNLLDNQDLRVNRAQLINAIQMAELMKNKK